MNQFDRQTIRLHPHVCFSVRASAPNLATRPAANSRSTILSGAREYPTCMRSHGANPANLLITHKISQKKEPCRDLQNPAKPRAKPRAKPVQTRPAAGILFDGEGSTPPWDPAHVDEIDPPRNRPL